jgi:hypothetical protein
MKTSSFFLFFVLKILHHFGENPSILIPNLYFYDIKIKTHITPYRIKILEKSITKFLKGF